MMARAPMTPSLFARWSELDLRRHDAPTRDGSDVHDPLSTEKGSTLDANTGADIVAAARAALQAKG